MLQNHHRRKLPFLSVHNFYSITTKLAEYRTVSPAKSPHHNSRQKSACNDTSQETNGAYVAVYPKLSLLGQNLKHTHARTHICTHIHTHTLDSSQFIPNLLCEDPLFSRVFWNEHWSRSHWYCSLFGPAQAKEKAALAGPQTASALNQGLQDLLGE